MVTVGVWATYPSIYLAIFLFLHKVIAVSAKLIPDTLSRGGVLEDVLGLEDVLEDTF